MSIEQRYFLLRLCQAYDRATRKREKEKRKRIGEKDRRKWETDRRMRKRKWIEEVVLNLKKSSVTPCRWTDVPIKRRRKKTKSKLFQEVQSKQWTFSRPFHPSISSLLCCFNWGYFTLILYSRYLLFLSFERLHSVSFLLGLLSDINILLMRSFCWPLINSELSICSQIENDNHFCSSFSLLSRSLDVFLLIRTMNDEAFHLNKLLSILLWVNKQSSAKQESVSRIYLLTNWLLIVKKYKKASNIWLR